jgi:WS/DGAT/MGAT family acyltransferase
MDRLTRDDQLVLWPDRVWPQDIGALCILDGAGLLDGSGAVRLGELRRLVAARLPRVPRLRQVLHVPRRGLGRPLWVDDPGFDIAHHVGAVALPAEADESDLLRAVEQLRRRRLDPHRPLWEMWLLPGLAGGRVALFLRLHHVVADGIAGTATMGALLDPDPTPAGEPPLAWTPAPVPSDRALLADNLRGRLRESGRAVAALTRPRATARRLRALWPAVREVLGADAAPATSLNRVIGGERVLALARGRLDEVRRTARAGAGTVNDVLLTATAGGLRALLAGRGEAVPVVPVFVPVTLRPADRRGGARGNLIGQMVVPLPVETADPGRRLAQIARETTRRKARPRPSLGAMFRGPVSSALLLKLLNRHPVNVETADLPGPAEPLYFAGARVLEVFPLLNLVGSVSLGVGALSYAGRVGIMAVADADVVPDLDVFAAGLQQDLDDFSSAGSAALAAVGSDAPADQPPRGE